jgi:hypothetical protein
LNPGDVQNFIFRDDDNGPFWMMQRMWAEKKEDKVVEEMKNVIFTKVELMDKLQQKGILTSRTYKKIKRS